MMRIIPLLCSFFITCYSMNLEEDRKQLPTMQSEKAGESSDKKGRRPVHLLKTVYCSICRYPLDTHSLDVCDRALAAILLADMRNCDIDIPMDYDSKNKKDYDL